MRAESGALLFWLDMMIKASSRVVVINVPKLGCGVQNWKLFCPITEAITPGQTKLLYSHNPILCWPEPCLNSLIIYPLASRVFVLNKELLWNFLESLECSFLMIPVSVLDGRFLVWNLQGNYIYICNCVWIWWFNMFRSSSFCMYICVF